MRTPAGKGIVLFPSLDTDQLTAVRELGRAIINDDVPFKGQDYSCAPLLCPRVVGESALTKLRYYKLVLFRVILGKGVRALDVSTDSWVDMHFVSEYLKKTPETIRNWIKTKNLPASKPGKSWMFKKSEIDAWLQSGGVSHANTAVEESKNEVSDGVVALSLFSGAGGLDIASFMANVPVVLSTDFDEDCIETLKLNSVYKDTELILGDLHEISSETFKARLKRFPHHKVILIGGAPCQPFSKAGYWITNKKRRGINDPRARLIDEYLRVMMDVRPNGFVFENVESLLHPTNKAIADQFLSIAYENGYACKVVRANALDYGVPQKRKRIFVLGTKGDFKSQEPKKTHCNPEQCEETGLLPHVAVGEAISGFESEEYFEPEEVTQGGTYHEDLCEVPPGMNYKALTAWYGYKNPKFVADKRFWSFLLKLSPEKPSWTITAQPGPWVGPFHWDNRRLRVPEIAAIQTFPRDYKFFGSRRSVQKQIGNAVPPLMGKAMIEFVRESLDEA